MMSEPGIRDLLRHSRFFEEATEEELEQIASVARLQAFSPGQILFRAGERRSEIFIVLEGSISLDLPLPGRGHRRICTIGPGELVGWSPLLGQQPMTATASALTSAEVVALEAAQILALCAHDPRLGCNFMHRVVAALAQRLSATRLQLLDVYSQELPVIPD